MAMKLPKAVVVRKYIEQSFDAHAPILVLHWQDTSGPGERLWELPEGMCVVGTLPRRFGVRIRRLAENRYHLRLLWENTQLNWTDLSRIELLAGCLSSLLAALDMDLWSLLQQPMPGKFGRQLAA